MSEIDMDSTPGFCAFATLGTTNGEILGWDGVDFDPERLEYVRGQVYARFCALLDGSMEADPIKVFVKQEPVKLKKHNDQAYRLISGVSLTDCLIDRILFGWLLRIVLDKVLETPSMIGWSPVRGGWRYVKGLFSGKPVVCLDRSAWDWTVVGWMIEDFESFILDLPVNAPLWWKEMVRKRLYLLYHSAVFRFQDGTEVEQDEWGIQKSGSLLTIIFNTVMQIMLHARVRPDCNKPIIALGDDTAQETPDDLEEYVRSLESLGPKLKGAKVQHWVEFAGFVFLQTTCFPAYWKKHLYKLKYAENPLETLQSYQILYSHNPAMFEYLESELTRLDVGAVYPYQWCRMVMDWDR